MVCKTFYLNRNRRWGGTHGGNAEPYCHPASYPLGASPPENASTSDRIPAASPNATSSPGGIVQARLQFDRAKRPVRLETVSHPFPFPVQSAVRLPSRRHLRNLRRFLNTVGHGSSSILPPLECGHRACLWTGSRNHCTGLRFWRPFLWFPHRPPRFDPLLYAHEALRHHDPWDSW